MWVTSVDFNYLPKKNKKNWQENKYSVPNSVVLEKWIICIFSILLISSQGYFHFEKKPWVPYMPISTYTLYQAW